MSTFIHDDSRGLSLGVTFKEKLYSLLADDAEQIPGENFTQNIICLVDNNTFGTAILIDSEKEYESLKQDKRKKIWLAYNYWNRLGK